MLYLKLHMGNFNSGKRLETKTYLILGLIFILTVGTVLYVVQYETNRIVTDLTLNRVQTANQNLMNYLSELEERVIIRAGIIAWDQTIIDALKTNDLVSLKKVLLNLTLRLDFASICNPDGIILIRTHSEKTGDNVSTQRDVAKVLKIGSISSSVSVVPTTESLAVCASAPIFENNKLIGIVNCNFDLTKNEYVDIFKKRTGCEATIFLNDKRISTTIIDESGNRITGLKAYDSVVQKVLKEKNEYLGELVLYGKTYGVCYSPLLIDNEAIGMAFTGVDICHTIESKRTMNSLIILASLIGLVASVIYMVISGIIARKYVIFSEKQLNQQVLMANISRVFLSDSNTTNLIRDTLRMVGEFMDISQLLLFMLEEESATLVCQEEWINQKIGLQSRIGSKLPLKGPILTIIRNLVPGTGKDSCLHSDDPFIKKSMAPYRVNFQNYITTPIFNKGELIGVIDFSKGGNSQRWSESDISLATLFASTLSGVFERETMGRRTSIVENSPHMIFYSDTTGTLAYANPAAATITGYTSAELKTGGFGLLFDEVTVNNIKEIFVPITLQKGLDHRELILLCKDGQKRILEVTSFVVQDGMVAAIAVDLTEERTLESELITAKNKADQASRAKSEFLSNMSHEMRTPMNAIIGMTTIAKNAEDTERKNYALSKIEEASTHLLGIINDILDMTKIEANKLELSHVEFYLKNVLHKAVAFVHFRMEEKRHRFAMNVNDNVPHFCIGDDQRLTQIIINLLSNAVKFTPEDGEISFNISLLGEENGILEICFEVADSGIGISAQQQEKLFRMFEQGESGITRKFGGTGLGLAFSKRIVELMGGKIYVESEPNKGSKFIFTVKLLRSSKAENTQSEQEKKDEVSNKNFDEPKVPQENEFSGKKVLLAEDIEINREVLISLLDGTGLIIDTAENGKEAMDKIIASPDLYDLIFMDLQMPEMDGLEATRQIRAFEAEQQTASASALASASNSALASSHSPQSNKPLRRIPIIAMTANVFTEDIENCRAAGMDDHIGKPIDINMVFEKLYKYLKKQGE